MSSHSKRSIHSSAEVKCNTLDGSEKIKLNEMEEVTALHDCLDVLLYEDGMCKPLTHSTLTQLKHAKSKMSEANALFIEGVRLCNTIAVTTFKHLTEAEERGCDHPILYYHIAECYTWGDRGVAKDAVKASKYHDMAIAGTSIPVTSQGRT